MALSLDKERVSDKVWTTGRIAKSIKAKILPHLIHEIHTYLQSLTFSIIHGSSHSSFRHIRTGVPRGSLLGPTLSIVYINDIPSTGNDPKVSISIYAEYKIIKKKRMEHLWNMFKITRHSESSKKGLTLIPAFLLSCSS